MTITLPPELEAALAQRATLNGTTLEEIVLDTLQQNFIKQTSHSQTPDDWTKRLARLAAPAGVSLAKDTISS